MASDDHVDDDRPDDPLSALDAAGRLLGEPLLAGTSTAGGDALDLLVAATATSWPGPRVDDAQPSAEVAAELARLARVDEVSDGAPDGADGSSPDPTVPDPTVPDLTVPDLAVPMSTGAGPVLPPSAPRPTPRPTVTTPFPGAPATPPRRRRGRLRRLLGRFVSLTIVAALIGGAVLAYRHFVLETRWSADVQPLADEVAAARGLAFTDSVDIVELPVAEYAERLATVTLGLTDATVDQVAGEWRSLGLLDGVLDLEQLGRSALPDAPAVYDPATGKIVVAAGLADDLRTFAVQRALALALLDQTSGWSDTREGASPAVVMGTRALVEADALETALSLVVESERLAIGGQLLDLYARLGTPPSASPFATAVIARLGVATWPVFRGADAAERAALVSLAPVADADVFDLRRLAGLPQGTSAVGADSRGVLYWYHVLAARIDDDLAWRTALTWRADAVTVIRTVDRVCVAGSFESSSADLAPGAFAAWADGSPVAVTLETTAVADGVRISINVCDPGARVVTNDGSSRLSLGGAPLRSEQFRRLREVNPELSWARLACIISVPDPISLADERGVIDAVDGWPAPAAHPTGDVAQPECAAL